MLAGSICSVSIAYVFPRAGGNRPLRNQRHCTGTVNPLLVAGRSLAANGRPWGPAVGAGTVGGAHPTMFAGAAGYFFGVAIHQLRPAAGGVPSGALPRCRTGRGAGGHDPAPPSPAMIMTPNCPTHRAAVHAGLRGIHRGAPVAWRVGLYEDCASGLALGRQTQPPRRGNGTNHRRPHAACRSRRCARTSGSGKPPTVFDQFQIPNCRGGRAQKACWAWWPGLKEFLVTPRRIGRGHRSIRRDASAAARRPGQRSRRSARK